MRKFRREDVTKRMKFRNKQHPLIRKWIDLVHRETTTLADISDRSGIGYGTLRNWHQGKSQPLLFAFADVLESMGYRIAIVKVKD